MKVILLVMLSFGLIANASTDDIKEFAYLNGSPGIDGEGICIFLEDEQGNITELITTDGALSKEQTREAVRYATYREQHLGLSPFAGSAFFAINPTAGKVAIVVGQFVYFAYMYDKGQKEEESSLARGFTVTSLFPFNYYVESRIRQNRLNHLVNEEKRLTFQDRGERNLWLHVGFDKYLGLVKLEKMKSRLQEISPEYPQGCDHLVN